MNSVSSDEFTQRFHTLQGFRDTSEGLINDLLIYIRQIESVLKTKQLDLDDATESRRDLQGRTRNPYIIILLDGDGMIFKESLVRQGIEGGKKAAYALRNAAAEKCGTRVDEVEILCIAWANLGGLSRAMLRDGSIENDIDLKEFTLGFTQAMTFFDFVDVGYGKERADSKIREATRWHLRNNNCQHVLLGISHDAGYGAFLDNICQDEQTRGHLTILEGFPTHKAIASTGLDILNLTHEIFRSDKLRDRVQATPLQERAQAVVTTIPLVTSPVQAIASPVPISKTYPGLPTPPTPERKGASPPPTITLPIPLKSTAKDSATRKPIQKIVSQMTTTNLQPNWNPGERGLDLPLHVNPAILQQLQKRKPKLCNNHYLRGPCTKYPDCTYDHTFEPETGDLVALAYLTRLNPCTSGQECDVENCIYGHHCPSTRDGVCKNPYCKFEEEDHPPGTKFTKQKKTGSCY